MKCPLCDAPGTRVIDSGVTGAASHPIKAVLMGRQAVLMGRQVVRRRQCRACKARFVTTERISAVAGHDISRVRVDCARRDRPEQYAAQNIRDSTRRQARKEAAETGEPVEKIFERWGVS